MLLCVSSAFQQELRTLGKKQTNQNKQTKKTGTGPAQNKFARINFYFSAIPLRAINEDAAYRCYDSVINARLSVETSRLCDDATLIPLWATCKAVRPTAAPSSEAELCLSAPPAVCRVCVRPPKDGRLCTCLSANMGECVPPTELCV